MSVRYHEKAAMESCKRANMTNAAIVIESLLQQRAELLEALKGVKKWNDHLGMLSSKLVQSIDEAITKAEAAE